ncbi:KAP family P-loop NTPase fold protein [Vibrio diabolicus]|uniref:KAP family P-loop NTPase fold protein n=1 Tax=Vibrio diabolicus TaxID=50719 RepID=UPI00215EC8E6|nr:KAP family NTPase [Vibrio diabolicus]MCS0388853.1 KAP family NTPase [Vibrio diabolicus]
MRLTVPELQIGDSEGFSPEKDLFQRKAFGDRLYNLISNSDENLVLALDAQWGEGKSTFIKMWAGENRNKSEHPLETIYFDAFENDYQKEPFLALASEIYELLEDKAENKKQEFKDKAAQVFKTFSRGVIKTGIRIGTAGAIDGTLIDQAEKEISTLVSEQVDSLISSKFESSKADKLALKNFKTFLSDIALNHTEGKRIVFIVDELDRCRPDFALELLENIKHLFSVSGITFLLVMNRSQLEESVKCRYGNGIDSVTYLQKFINVWLSLPRSSGKYQQDDGAKYLRSSLDLMTVDKNILNESAMQMLDALVKYLKPSFRDIERILTYFAIVENSENQTMDDFYQDIMALVCFLKVVNPRLLDAIISKRAGSQELLDFLQLSENSERMDDYALEYLATEIEFDLSSQERRKEIMENQSLSFRFGRAPTDVINYFYQQLNNIQPVR